MKVFAQAMVIASLLASIGCESASEQAAEVGAAMRAGDWGAAIFWVFLGGIGTALTPCVYPMIAITVAVFGASKQTSRLKAATLSAAFVLGLATLFVPLGVVSALAGTMMSEWMTHPWVLLVFALLFFGMAMSMFGLFDLRLPGSLNNRLSKVGGVGIVGAFVVGLVSALIAAPCVGPVLVVLLSYIATSRDVVLGGFTMLAYALGMGVLFFFVGTFAISLPKSGRWLNWVKSVFGIVMLVLALYYLRFFFRFPSERNDLWLAMSVVFSLIGLTLGAIHLDFHNPNKWVRARKGLGIALVTVGSFSTIGWMSALRPGERITWLDDYDAGRRVALRDGKYMLVDFGADWCQACHELEAGPMSDPRVVAATRDWVAIRIDLSTGVATDRNKELLKTYKAAGLPLVVFHEPGGTEIGRVVDGSATANDFLRLMNASNR